MKENPVIFDEGKNRYENHLVLSRKYRPATLDDIVGQEVLVTSIRNAFSLDKIAHAFLFTGVRGVGKTTVARVIALGLNCLKHEKPTTSPCGKCSNCLAIMNDRYDEVTEIDAASHTGVDEIRDLVEGMKYKTVSGRYRVYIIDEVHMLSLSAFNALLKTIEEPPSHVKFIFCTTEVKKIPITILSRCQRYDLRRVGIKELNSHIKKITISEKINISDDAIHLLSKVSEGSVRDSLTFLEQAIIGVDCKKKITEEILRNMMGLSDGEKIIQLLEKIIAGDVEKSLEILEDITNCGAEPLLIIQELLSMVHLMAYIKVTDGKNEKEIAENAYNKLKEISADISIPIIGKLWHMFVKALDEINICSNPYDALEMILIRISFSSNLPDPSILVKDLYKEYKGNDVIENTDNKNIREKIDKLASEDNREIKDILESFPESEIVNTDDNQKKRGDL